MEYIISIYITLYIIGIVLFLHHETFKEAQKIFPLDLIIIVGCLTNIPLYLTFIMFEYLVSNLFIWVQTEYTTWKVNKIVNKIKKKYKL